MPQNANYSDLSRRWSGLSPSHLEHLAEAVTTSNNVAEATATNMLHINLLQAAGEIKERRDGRTLQDAITLEEATEDKGAATGLSILHSPILINTGQKVVSTAVEEPMIDAERPSSPLPSIQMQSSYSDVAQQTADAMRQYLLFRERVQLAETEIKSLQNSLAKQKETHQALSDKFQVIGRDTTMTGVQKLEVFDEIKTGKQDCERVIAQLERKLVDLTTIQGTNRQEMVRLEAEARSYESKRKILIRCFHDPLGSLRGPLSKGSRIGGNCILHTVLGRQQGMSRSRLQPMPSRSLIRDGPNPTHFAATRKSLLCSRLAHAATINTHISYPVYCLRFDHSGRYFMTGADDYLIKVFYLGAGQSCRTKNEIDGSKLLRCNYGSNMRGAVLVCSLRGHAGVINDIDVSADNAFLATASVDGDVRIWGLRDGCPIAILRGHKGGANMVSDILVWRKEEFHIFVLRP